MEVANQLSRMTNLASSVMLATALLFFVCFPMSSTADDICRVEAYRQRVNVNGFLTEVDMGQCAVIASYFIRPTLGFHEHDARFSEIGRGCCCSVSNYVTRTLMMGPNLIKYKQITDCACAPCTSGQASL